MPSERTGKLVETDLYAPVRDYLLARGYTVRGEVHHCDLVAARGDDLIVIELKVCLSLDLLIQATKRQRATASVYVAVPPPSTKTEKARWKGVRHLLRRLEIGLLVVSANAKTPSVKLEFHPIPYDQKKLKRDRRAILREIEGRSRDLNQGGSTRRKLVTAYRENAVQIACCLQKLGPSAPKQLRALGTGPKTLAILSRNVYHWFERTARGIYALTPEGAAALSDYPELTAGYLAELGEYSQKDVKCP